MFRSSHDAARVVQSSAQSFADEAAIEARSEKLSTRGRRRVLVRALGGARSLSPTLCSGAQALRARALALLELCYQRAAPTADPLRYRAAATAATAGADSLAGRAVAAAQFLADLSNYAYFLVRRATLPSATAR